MLYELKENIKIREEDGFYLVVNLTTEDMLKGYPSFFKVNNVGAEILRILRKPLTEKEIIEELYYVFPEIEQNQLSMDADIFINKLIQYSLIKED